MSSVDGLLLATRRSAKTVACCCSKTALPLKLTCCTGRLLSRRSRAAPAMVVRGCLSLVLRSGLGVGNRLARVAEKTHCTPLCGRVLESSMRRGSWAAPRVRFVFVNERGKSLGGERLTRLLKRHGIAAVPHGFRSSFRDWVAEETDHPISRMGLHRRNYMTHSGLQML